MLAQKGKRVLLVDADSQCNLTSIVLGEDQFEQFYIDNPERNLKSGLSPALVPNLSCGLRRLCASARKPQPVSVTGVV